MTLRERSRGPSRRVTALLAVAVAGMLAHAWSFGFEIDDAYISFRYAQNLVAGHGLTFNPGEWVEGYTNPLWVLLAALGIALGIEPLVFARVLGAAAMAGVVVLIPRAVTHIDPGAAPLAPGAAVIVASTGALACWTFAGLETPLVAFLVLGAVITAAGSRPLTTSVLALLLYLTRPDGVLIGGGCLLWAIVAAHRGPGHAAGPAVARRSMGAIALLGAGIALHLLWRHATYDAWLPNTYHAKTGDPIAQVRTGVPYALSFLRAYGGAWLLVGTVAAALTRGRAFAPAALRAALCLTGAWSAYVVLVGGDGLGMYRFFVPILPVLIAAGIALLAAALRSRGAALSGRAAIVLTLGLAGVHSIASFIGTERALVTAHMSEVNLGGWKRAGDTLARVLPDSVTIALAPVGYIPYRTGLRTVDILGLTDRHIARREMPFEIGYAGHEKHDGAYVLSRRPHYLLLGNVDVTAEPRRTVIPPFRPELDIYKHPDFRNGYEQVSLSLDGGGHLNCFRRRDPSAGGDGARSPVTER